MNKFAAIAMFALVVVVAVAVGAQASGYGYGQSSYGYPQQSYGQNYERKTGFKTVIYHPYGGVSNRFDYRTYPAYGSSYGSQYPAPYIRTGLDYTIGDNGYGSPY